MSSTPTTHRHSGLTFYSVRLNPTNSDNTMIWLGGSMQSVASMQRYNERYAQHFDFVGIDLPGMGDADFCPPHLDDKFLADCIEQVRKDYDLGKVNIACASYGGFSALAYCVKYSKNVKRLVATATMANVIPETRGGFEAYVQAACEGDKATMAAVFAGQLFNIDREVDIPNAKALRRALGASVKRITDSDMQKIAANTQRLLNHKVVLPHKIAVKALLFTGEHDLITPWGTMLELAEHFKDATITTVHSSDHMSHMEQPDVYFNLIRGFLQGEAVQRVQGQALGVTLPLP